MLDPRDDEKERGRLTSRTKEKLTITSLTKEMLEMVPSTIRKWRG
jgi:hypothetical protein